jgi:flavin reductase (DIM6/NTAB) family NADH-FMN oxidoreductase RutF
MAESELWIYDESISPANPELTNEFLRAMSSLAATVTVAAAASPTSGRTGATATAVCSLSTEPPMMVVCLNRESSLAKMLRRTGWFSVNLLASGQEGIAADFSGRTGLSGEERFGPQWHAHKSGTPVLDGAVATCICRIVNSMQQATHTVIIGEVHDVVMSSDSPPAPLVYHDRRFTTLT